MKSKKRDKIEELVWYELVHSKYWEQYLSEYIGVKIDWRKRYNIITVIASIFGISSWKGWELFDGVDVSFISLVVIATTQILSAIKKDIIIDNETQKSIMSLRSKYILYFNKVERLFIEIEDKKITREKLIEKYYILRDSVCELEELKDSLNINKLRKADKKGIKNTMTYLKNRYEIET